MHLYLTLKYAFKLKKYECKFSLKRYIIPQNISMTNISVFDKIIDFEK